MQTYGLSFTLIPRQVLPEPTVATIQGVVLQWLYTKLEKLDAPLAEQFKTEDMTYDDGSNRVWEFTLTQPFEENSLWRTELRVLESEPPLKCSVCMRIISSSSKIAPLSFYVETPHFLRILGKQYRIFIGDTEATSLPVRIDDSDTQDFVRQIRDVERAVPLVVISHPASNPPLLPEAADRLSRYLFPLANVIELTQSATWALTAALGKEMSCFDGGIRIYWPGWSEEDSPLQHPLWWKGKILISLDYDADDPYRLIRMSIMRSLARASAARFEYPSEIIRVMRNHRKLEEVALLHELGITKPDELPRHVKKLLEELEFYREYSKELEEQNTELTSRNEQVSYELRALEAKFSSRRDEPNFWEVQSRTEAVAKAKADFSETLIFARDFECAPFAGSYIYQILQCLDELCRLERQGTGRSPRGELAEIMVRRLGFPKFLEIGDTQLFATDPETGERIHLRRRVHINSGPPTKTLSVYWEKIGERRTYKYLVGRIGRHA